jgi:hypothetical protein
MIRDARHLLAEYRRRGEHLSQRRLAKHLRTQGHAVSNGRVPEISAAIGLS